MRKQYKVTATIYITNRVEADSAKMARLLLCARIRSVIETSSDSAIITSVKATPIKSTKEA